MESLSTHCDNFIPAGTNKRSTSLRASNLPMVFRGLRLAGLSEALFHGTASLSIAASLRFFGRPRRKCYAFG